MCQKFEKLYLSRILLLETIKYCYTYLEVRHIYREYNQTADALANAALDDENGNGPSEHW